MSAARVSRRDFMRGRVRPVLSAQLVAREDADRTPAPSAARIAQLDPGRCLAAASQICTVCKERCGAQDAISLRGLLPQISAARCTGCGACVDACPAPDPALRLVPREQTP